MEDDDTENISPVNEESLESSESMKDAKKPSNIPANGDAAPMTTPENNAVEAGSDHAEISKPVSQTTPPQGVSKFAVEKLMQTNSSRVQVNIYDYFSCENNFVRQSARYNNKLVTCLLLLRALVLDSIVLCCIW